MSLTYEPLAYHVLFTTYGFWLPNEERGSGSDFVRADHLTKFGPPTKLHSRRRSRAYEPYDPEIRRMARESLKYPYVEFDGRQAQAVGLGFKDEIERYGGTIYACAIMDTHVHQVIGPHRYDIRRFAGRLKGAATKRLRAEGLHPLQEHPLRDGRLPSPWARLEWVVFLWTEEDVSRAIRYVEQNPIKKALRPQRWSFVTPYTS